MTNQQLIGALQEECRLTKTGVEDFLAALSDLFGAALEKEETVNLAGVGVFRLRGTKNGVRAVKFCAAPELRERLKLLEWGKRHGELCAACGQRLRGKNRSLCARCANRKYKKAGGGRREARDENRGQNSGRAD